MSNLMNHSISLGITYRSMGEGLLRSRNGSKTAAPSKLTLGTGDSS